MSALENPTPIPGRGSHAVQESVFGSLVLQDEDAYLRDLTGAESLEHARTLRVVVNTAIGSGISHLGGKLMNLVELNLSGSMLESIRDLGTGFRSLQVLWVSRCGLPGLDGLTALPALRELYASYNDISDLQPLDGCAELEVLDLEGNCVEDQEALHVLGSCCTKLQSLSLAGNPFASALEYQELAARLIVSLIYLDDVRLPSASGLHGASAIGEDTESQRASAAEIPGAASVSEIDSALSDGSMRPLTCMAPDGGGEVASSPAESELLLVLSGIKHARVGVDSAEFRELEMTLLMASALPPEDSPAPGTTMLPVSASSWMRCSQQGSLPSLIRSRSHSLASAGPAASSLPRVSTGGSAGSSGRPRDVSISGYGSQDCLQPQPTPRRGNGGSGRPPTARPFSARIGTASSAARPGTAALGAAFGSAPPTAGGGGMTGGLYWKKNRLLGTLGGGSGKTSIAMEGDEDAGGSALTFGGSEGTIGGSLAKDLRRRKRATPLETGKGKPGGSLLDMASQTGGATSSDSIVVAAQTGMAHPRSERSSYDSAALLEELRRWKVEAADRALMPAEDEATDGPAWPDSFPSSGGQRAEVAEFGRPSVDGEGASLEDELDGTDDISDLLRIPSMRSDSSLPESDQNSANPTPRGGTNLSGALLMPLRSPSLSRPNSATPIPLDGKPPLVPQRPASGSRGPSQRAAMGVPGSPQASSVMVPSSPQQQSPYQLGPVTGPRPSRTSKMTLCKVIGETTGTTIKTGRGSFDGHEAPSFKSRSLALDESLSQHSKRGNPLFLDTAGPHEAYHASARVMQNVCSTERKMYFTAFFRSAPAKTDPIAVIAPTFIVQPTTTQRSHTYIHNRGQLQPPPTLLQQMWHGAPIHYPEPQATHEEVVRDRDLFVRTHEELLTHLGIKLKIPKVGGIEVDLHRLYVEVTSLGGIEPVINRKQWVVVCEPFNFPSSFTNKSFVIKKLYTNALHHYEQVYLHRTKGPMVPAPTGQSDACLAALPAGGGGGGGCPSSPPPLNAVSLSTMLGADNRTPPKRKTEGQCESPAQAITIVPASNSNSGSPSAPSMNPDLPPGTRFTGVIDCNFDQGYMITLNMPGQRFQGILYKQYRGSVTGGMMLPQQASQPTRVTGPNVHPWQHNSAGVKAQEALSQELDSRHETGGGSSAKRFRMGNPHATSTGGHGALLPSPPRMARTPYQFFQLGVNKDQLLQLRPDPTSPATKEVLPKLMSDLWHQMTPDQRQPFLHMAAKDRERYEKDAREYRRRMAEAGVGSFEDIEGEVTIPMTASMMMPPQRLTKQPSGSYQHPSPHSQLHAMSAFELHRQQQMRLSNGRGHSMEGSHVPPGSMMMATGRVVPGTTGGMAIASVIPGDIMQPSLLLPDMDPEELDHLCHYGGNSTAFGQQHFLRQQQLNQAAAAAAGRIPSESPIMHGLALDDQADFELAMRSFRSQPEGAAAAVGIDLFGCSAQVQRLAGGDGGAAMGIKMESAMMTHEKALGKNRASADHDVAAIVFPKGGPLRRVSGQDPSPHSSAGSPSDGHISQAAFNGLGGGQAAGRAHRDLCSDGGAAVVEGFFRRSLGSSGGGGYPALYPPASPFDYAMTLAEEPMAVHHPLA